MDARVSIITLGVSDLNASVAFYRDGLGWPTNFEPEHGIAFFKTAGTVFALYPIDKMAEELPDPDFKPAPGSCGIVTAHNVHTREEVDAIIKQAESAGATVKKEPSETFWGGYSGYFSDPDGYLWEIAHGAFPIGDDGHLILP